MSFGANPLPVMNGRAMIYVGDTLAWLRDMSDESVDCVVTSPPYWGLRDYGTAFWAEGDANCEHVVGELVRTPWANRIKGPNGGRTIPGYRDQSPARHTGGRCLKCGAVRADYQIGLEPTLGQHLEVMVEICAEVWRVLKPTGTMWINYGDCYATEPNGRSASATKAAGHDDRTFRDKPMSTVGPILGPAHGPRNDPKRRMSDASYQPGCATPRGVFEAAVWGASGAGIRRVDHGGRVVAGGYLKDKDLCMIPNRLAIALQEWGWWVRSEIVWGKTNPMPDSSGRQRPSTAHEKIFLFTKSADADVWYARDTGEISFRPDLSEEVPLITKPDKLGKRWLRMGAYYDAAAMMQQSSDNTHARMAQNIDGHSGSARAHASYNAALMTRDRQRAEAPHRRADGVGNDPRHEGHINHTGLRAAERGRGRLLRNFEGAADPVAPLPVWAMATQAFKEAHFATFPPELAQRCIEAGCPPGGLVLDPFGGAGTTALVALRLGRRCDMIELKPDYAEMSQRRIELDWMGEDERKRQRAKAAQKDKPVKPGPLFAEAAE